MLFDVHVMRLRVRKRRYLARCVAQIFCASLNLPPVCRTILHSCTALHLLHLKRDKRTIGHWREKEGDWRVQEVQLLIARANGHVAIRARHRTIVIARVATRVRRHDRQFNRVTVQKGIDMSFGSGFGASTSTPAPTFAFGTTPASTATPVKPGKSLLATKSQISHLLVLPFSLPSFVRIPPLHWIQGCLRSIYTSRTFARRYLATACAWQFWG